MSKVVDDDLFREFLEYCRDMHKGSMFSINSAGVRSFLVSGSKHDVDECHSTSSSDVDLMHISGKFIALPWRMSAAPFFWRRPAGTDVCVLVIDTVNIHVGYAKLLQADIIGSPPLSHAKFLTFVEEDLPYRHGPAKFWSKNTPTLLAYWIGNMIVFLLQRENKSRSKRRWSFPEYLNTLAIGGMDTVAAIRCPQWPSQATEWTTRQRFHGWPSKDVVDRIVRFGCYFVAVGHQLSPDKNVEFRLSFSRAENILVSVWQSNQRKIYCILKWVKLRIAEVRGKDRVIMCSYYFKTLMLWASEQRPREFWNDDQLLISISTLLCQMVEWMIDKCCPNYFIPHNNMMDHIQDRQGLEEESQVILISLPLLDSMLQKYDDEEFLSGLTTFTLSDLLRKANIPDWFCNALKLQVINWIPFDFFKSNDSDIYDLTATDTCLIFEFGDLYRGLVHQLRGKELMQEVFYTAAEEWLTKATTESDRLPETNKNPRSSLNNSTSRCITDKLAFIFMLFSADQNCENNCHPSSWPRTGGAICRPRSTCETLPVFSETADYDEHKYESASSFENKSHNAWRDAVQLLYGDILDVKVTERAIAAVTAFVDAYGSHPVDNINDTNFVSQYPNGLRNELAPSLHELFKRVKSIFYKGFDLFTFNLYELFPHKLSLSCSQIYLANFLFVTKRNRPKALCLCNHVIHDSNSDLSPICRLIFSPVGNESSPLQFSVLISNRLAPLFDDEIKTVLGFVTLSNNLLYSRTSTDFRRNLALSLRPVQFANYIKMRCLLDRWESSEADTSTTTLLQYVVDDLWKSYSKLYGDIETPSQLLLLVAAHCALPPALRGGDFKQRLKTRRDFIIAIDNRRKQTETTGWEGLGQNPWVMQIFSSISNICKKHRMK